MNLFSNGLLLLLCFTVSRSHKVSEVQQERNDENLMRLKRAADSPNVVVQKFSLLVEGRDEVSVDLTQGGNEGRTFSIKEGSEYRIKIYFLVQRDIVTGLRYQQVVTRRGIKVDSVSELMGSYGPNADVQSFTTRVDEAPSGMTRRGVYEVESSVRDDARNVYLRWKWNFEVKADW